MSSHNEDAACAAKTLSKEEGVAKVVNADSGAVGPSWPQYINSRHLALAWISGRLGALTIEDDVVRYPRATAEAVRECAAMAAHFMNVEA